MAAEYVRPISSSLDVVASGPRRGFHHGAEALATLRVATPDKYQVCVPQSLGFVDAQQREALTGLSR